jgi:hypothetical protein
VGTDEPVDPIAIRERERRQPELDRAVDELLRTAGPLQEGEVALRAQRNVRVHDLTVRLSNARLSNARLSSARLSNVRLSNVRLSNVRLSPCASHRAPLTVRLLIGALNRHLRLGRRFQSTYPCKNQALLARSKNTQ